MRTAELPATDLQHGDIVRHKAGGCADQHKVLGVELNLYGEPRAVVWDYRSASVWSASPDTFVKLTPEEIAKGKPTFERLLKRAA